MKTQQKVIFLRKPASNYSRIFQGVTFTITKINSNCNVAILKANGHPSIVYKDDTVIDANGFKDLIIHVDMALLEPAENMQGEPPEQLIEWVQRMTTDQLKAEITAWTDTRKRCNITQQDIAAIVGSKFPNISALENLREFSRMLVAKYIHAISIIKSSRGL